MIIDFELAGDALPIEVDTLIIAGWTGSNPEAVQHHIEELRELGVKPPASVPMFYRLGADRVTLSGDIEVVGDDSSGEAEFVLIQAADELYIGVGSDHTDRVLEAYGVTMSKQVCPKPVSTQVWRYTEVAAHWAQLQLRSYVTANGVRRLYQEGSVTSMLAPQVLIGKYMQGGERLSAGTVMFCGTLPAIGPISGGEVFEAQLHDPVLNRTLAKVYTVKSLPIAD